MKRRKGTGRKCLALLLAAAMILGIVPADGYGKEGDPAAIKTTTVENADNLEYSTEGGNDTEDKVFLLSETDCWGTNAASYGFVNNYNTDDEGRRSKTSTYAYAMGTHRSTSTDYAGNCWWWLRSPGYDSSSAARVIDDGWGSRDGDGVIDSNYGVRAALNLNLSSSHLYTYAGTVCSDGTESEVGGGSSGGSSSGGESNGDEDQKTGTPKILSMEVNNTDDDGYVTGYDTDEYLSVSGWIKYEEGYTREAYEEAWDALTWSSSDEDVVTVESSRLKFGLMDKPSGFSICVTPQGLSSCAWAQADRAPAQRAGKLSRKKRRTAGCRHKEEGQA